MIHYILFLGTYLLTSYYRVIIMTRQEFSEMGLIDQLDLIAFCHKRDLENSIDEIIKKISETDAIFKVLNLEGFD